MIRQQPSVIRFVDLSYVMYNRWYATCTKLSVGPDSDGVAHDSFRKEFTQGFRNDIERLHRHGQPADVPLRQLYASTVFVYDCMRNQNWRNAILPGYKMKKPERTSNDHSMFELTFDHVVPGMVREFGIATIKHPNAEADDIIGIIKRFMARAFPTLRFEIFANDKDYLQLHCPRTRIINIQGKNIYDREMEKIAKKTGKAVEAIAPGTLLDMKILRGDPSDKITSVGKLTLAETKDLAEDRDKLDDYRCKDDATGKKFDLNRRLIDMECISPDVQAGILKAWSELVKTRRWAFSAPRQPAKRPVQGTYGTYANCVAG